MSDAIRKILGAAAAILSFMSGIFWYQSAGLQLTSLSWALPLTHIQDKAVELAAKQNLWAGSAGAAAGVCLALALIFES